MAYHGYVPYLQDRLMKLQRPPLVLEIGVDRGVTLIPLVVAMASVYDAFTYVGVDIKIQESVGLTLANLGSLIKSSTYLMQENSLTFLPKLLDSQMKFDVVLLDGDHNYPTVSKELEYLDAITTPEAIVVVDDYDGKWSTRDMWYAERPGYEDNALASKKNEEHRHSGVKPAVDEWLEKNPLWKLYKPIEAGEPVILSRVSL